MTWCGPHYLGTRTRSRGSYVEKQSLLAALARLLVCHLSPGYEEWRETTEHTLHHPLAKLLNFHTMTLRDMWRGTLTKTT